MPCLLRFPNTGADELVGLTLWLSDLSLPERRELDALLEQDGPVSDWCQDHGWDGPTATLLPGEMPPAWLHCWRKGFLPQFGYSHLREMLDGLESDNPRLLQGVTTSPPPLQSVQDWDVEGCDLICYGVVGTRELTTVGETEEWFARACFRCDQLVGEPGGCRHFLNWYDETLRPEMREKMIREIRLDLAALAEEPK